MFEIGCNDFKREDSLIRVFTHVASQGMDSGHPFNVISNDGYNNNDDDDYGVGYNAISEATNTYLSRFWIRVCCL